MSLHRTSLSVVALAATSALVAGCAAGGPAADPVATETPTGEVTFWSFLSGMSDVAAAFNASQDDITVNFEEIPNGANGGYTKLSASAWTG